MELADRVGIHATHVYRIERGVAPPSRALATRLAMALRADVSEALLYAHYLPVDADFDPSWDLHRLLQIYMHLSPADRRRLLEAGSAVATRPHEAPDRE